MADLLDVVAPEAAHLEQGGAQNGREVVPVRRLAAARAEPDPDVDGLGLEARLLEVEDDAVGERHPDEVRGRERFALDHTSGAAEVGVRPGRDFRVDVGRGAGRCLAPIPNGAEGRGLGGMRPYGRQERPRPGPVLLARGLDVERRQVADRGVEAPELLRGRAQHIALQRAVHELRGELRRRTRRGLDHGAAAVRPLIDNGRIEFALGRTVGEKTPQFAFRRKKAGLPRVLEWRHEQAGRLRLAQVVARIHLRPDKGGMSRRRRHGQPPIEDVDPERRGGPTAEPGDVVRTERVCRLQAADARGVGHARVRHHKGVLPARAVGRAERAPDTGGPAAGPG